MFAASAAAALLLTTPFASGPTFFEQSSPQDEIHCVMEATEFGAVPQTTEPICFETYEDADEFIQRIGSDAQRSAAASVSIATIYEHASYGGSSLSFYGTSGCSGVTFGFASLPSGWDTRVSSATGRNGCSLSLYTGTDYSGSVVQCRPGCASLSATWNDNVRSLVARP